ncbi:MAG: hypothetical protein J0L58_20680, partial [Burkholderiales bacterium]|nr:hypothetical protein [Burkholderiales bacterium]
MTSVFVDSRWVGGAKAAAAWLMSGWTPSRAPVVGERRQEAERPAIERIRNLIGWRRSQNLVGRRYGQRGLRVGPAGSPEPGLTTLEAHDGRRLVGTLSVRMDGPDGLAADASSKDNCYGTKPLAACFRTNSLPCWKCQMAVFCWAAIPTPIFQAI